MPRPCAFFGNVLIYSLPVALPNLCPAAIMPIDCSGSSQSVNQISR